MIPPELRAKLEEKAKQRWNEMKYYFDSDGIDSVEEFLKGAEAYAALLSEHTPKYEDDDYQCLSYRIMKAVCAKEEYGFDDQQAAVEKVLADSGTVPKAHVEKLIKEEQGE